MKPEVQALKSMVKSYSMVNCKYKFNKTVELTINHKSSGYTRTYNYTIDKGTKIVRIYKSSGYVLAYFDKYITCTCNDAATNPSYIDISHLPTYVLNGLIKELDPKFDLDDFIQEKSLKSSIAKKLKSIKDVEILSKVDEYLNSIMW